MRRHSNSFLGLALIAGAALAGACGDNTKTFVCGEGTTANEDGECIGDGGGLNCGTGTIANAEGTQCVPDGSVICGDGTEFNPDTGECESTGCGPGLVLVNGTCIDESLVDPDLEEAAEPNDAQGAGEFAGQIAVPAIGSPGIVIHGCVDPYQDLDGDGNPDADFDYWIIDAAAPMALHVSADGVGGLASAFAVVSGDAELADAGFQRIGASLVNDHSERELYLPKAGIYAIAMTDSRSLFIVEGGGAAGGPEACYYASIEQIALPAATPGTITDTAGTDDGTLRVLSFDPDEGDLFDQLLDDGGSTALSAGFDVLLNDTYVASAVESTDIFGSPIPAAAFTAGYAATDTVTVVIDSVFNIGLAPQDYTFVTSKIGAQALPTAGTDATITPTGAPSFNLLGDLNWLYFDVAAAGDVVHFDVDFNGDTANLLIVDSALFIQAQVSFPDDPEVAGFGPGEFIRFAAPGRYYAVVFRGGEPPANTWTLTSTVTSQSASALVVGTPVADAGLPTTGSAFYSLDPGTTDWARLTAGVTNGGATVTARVYDLAGAGWLGETYLPLNAGYSFVAAGTDSYEHIFKGDTRDFLVQITAAAPGATTTYDLDVSAVPFVDLGTIVDGTPLPLRTDSFVAFDFVRYIASAAAGSQLSIDAAPNAATPNIDIIMQSFFSDYRLRPRLSQFAATDYNVRADDGVDGDPETLATGINTLGFVAFGVQDYFGDPGTIDLTATATSPTQYTVADGTLAFSDACVGGTVLAQTAVGTFGAIGDEAVTAAQTLPFPFELHGGAATSFYVSTNGFLSFTPSVNDAFFSNTALPNPAAPNSLVAAYWDDLDGIVICRKDTATTVTLQWVGFRFNDAVTTIATQAVLHSDQTIDFIYGATQLGNGVAGTVGTENSGIGTQIAFNMTGVILPSTSKTLTPVP